MLTYTIILVIKSVTMKSIQPCSLTKTYNSIFNGQWVQVFKKVQKVGRKMFKNK